MTKLGQSNLRRPLLEVGVVLAAIFADIWILRYFDNQLVLAPLWLIAAAAVIMSWRRRAEEDQGRGEPRRLRAWIEAVAVTSCMIAFLVVMVLVVSEPYDEPWFEFVRGGFPTITKWIGERLVWAAWQQVVLLTFLWPVLYELSRRAWIATTLSAVVIGAFHLPSAVLAVMTFCMALAFIVLYRRGRCLLPLVVAHAVIAAVGQIAVPERVHYDMKVGIDCMKYINQYRMLADEENRQILRTVTSPEYASARGGSDRAFVIGLYEDILGRTPAEYEVEHWLSWLERRSRNIVAKHFIKGDELTFIQKTYGDDYRFPFDSRGLE